MKTRPADAIFVVQEIEHVSYSRYFSYPPKAFTDEDAAEAYVRERALSYSEECLMAYESMEGGLDDPTEATFVISSVILDSKYEPGWEDGHFVEYIDDEE